MSDLSEAYRKSLNSLCLARGWVSQKNGERGSPSALVRELGRTSSFWSDRLEGRKPISKDLAFEIEDKLDLPRLSLAGWEETPDVGWPFSAQLRTAIQKLSRSEVRKAENMLRVQLGLPTLPALPQEVVLGGDGESGKRSVAGGAK